MHISTLLCLLLAALGPWLGQAAAQHGYRRQMNAMRSMAQKAFEHGLRINEEALCAKPRPELVYLTDSNKIYLPRATLLHRCSDLTGCCPHATQSCQPSQVETVSLYFFAISVQSLSRLRQNQNIEKLNFVNHTECSCVPVDQARSESLLHNETNAIPDSRQKATPVVKGGETTPVSLYSDELSSNQDANQIDINNGMSNSEDAQNSMLKYWGKLLGLYKAKVHRDVYHSGERHVEQSEEQQPTLRRVDAQSPRPNLPPAAFNALHYQQAPVPPYQSQYMYVYPGTSSQFSLMTEPNAEYAKLRTLNTNGYRLTYRQLE